MQTCICTHIGRLLVHELCFTITQGSARKESTTKSVWGHNADTIKMIQMHSVASRHCSIIKYFLIAYQQTGLNKWPFKYSQMRNNFRSQMDDIVIIVFSGIYLYTYTAHRNLFTRYVIFFVQTMRMLVLP